MQVGGVGRSDGDGNGGKLVEMVSCPLLVFRLHGVGVAIRFRRLDVRKGLERTQDRRHDPVACPGQKSTLAFVLL